jgi:hypothetical protein
MTTLVLKALRRKYKNCFPARNLKTVPQKYEAGLPLTLPYRSFISILILQPARQSPKRSECEVHPLYEHEDAIPCASGLMSHITVHVRLNFPSAYGYRKYVESGF